MQTRANKNPEKAAKKFYKHFKQERALFKKSITGVPDPAHLDWYASLTLNRLIFTYFIQKEHFLDNDTNYLRNHLKKTQQQTGDTDSFHRRFLSLLFHKGLAAPKKNKTLLRILGSVPSLNCELFNIHHIEREHKKIQIPDRAFENLFDFFDQYRWHLDARPEASSDEITPDVSGRIFEQYINDRTAMGAYYTQADITQYICQNTITPFLLDETRRNHPAPFEKAGFIWSLLKNSGDTYIYEAVKHGITYNVFDEKNLPAPQELPPEIEAGVIQAEDRKQKNFEKIAENRVAKRTGWNRTAPPAHALPAESWRETTGRRLRYAALKEKIKSGAVTQINEFVTFNLNISRFVRDVLTEINDPKFIEEFYKALQNITILDPACGAGAFLIAALNILEPLYAACLQRMQDFLATTDAEKQGTQFPFFERELVLLQKSEHLNPRYYIYKTIIRNNLYGMDIMPEALEIAKLRLYLKLVSTHANAREPNRDLKPLPDMGFNIRAGNALEGFAAFQRLQFDVIIGNPPYVSLSRFSGYLPTGFRTQNTGNLYSLIMEKSEAILGAHSQLGFVVPVSSFASENFQSLQDIFKNYSKHLSHFDDRPAHLFSGIDKNTLTIALMSKSPFGPRCTTRLQKWKALYRPYLFQTIRYKPIIENHNVPGGTARIDSNIGAGIYQKLARKKNLSKYLVQKSEHIVYYTRKINAFLQVTDFIPEIRNASGELRPPSELKALAFNDAQTKNIVLGGLCSSLFRWYVDLFSDGSNLNKREVKSFPIFPFSGDVAALNSAMVGLRSELLEHAVVRKMNYARGVLFIQCLYFAPVKGWIDRVDRIFAESYGLDAEEVDFILNYDVQYRVKGEGLGSGFG